MSRSRGEIAREDYLNNSVKLLNCLTGRDEEYTSPPWRLEGITRHPRGSLVKLVHSDGEQNIIPVMMQSEFIATMFKSWSEPH